MRTQRAIEFVKQTFAAKLGKELSLTKIAAPIFINSGNGVQDELNGVERPISFQALTLSTDRLEIVHSLAKWKRAMLAKYGVPVGEGIYTDMRAIRPDETDLSSGFHSIYVDQWDWERVIDKSERNLELLKAIVRKIYAVIKSTEAAVCKEFSLTPFLPDEIEFIHAEELLKMYPQLSPKQREHEICKMKKAIFLIGVGHVLEDGQKHDGRAPDYDDWSSDTSQGKKGLNGDIIVWNPIIAQAFELSSMGVRVDAEALRRQLKLCDSLHKLELEWHKALLDDKLPASIGGGIGQSRMVMLLLQKRHIGEVQVSVWPKEVAEKCQAMGIELL